MGSYIGVWHANAGMGCGQAVQAAARPLLLSQVVHAINYWQAVSGQRFELLTGRHIDNALTCAGAHAVAPAGGDMMQAPAAPQHELMVQEDGRDWALEQMAQAAAPSAAASADTSARRPLFEDISAGEGHCCTTVPQPPPSLRGVWRACCPLCC